MYLCFLLLLLLLEHFLYFDSGLFVPMMLVASIVPNFLMGILHNHRCRNPSGNGIRSWIFSGYRKISLSRSENNLCTTLRSRSKRIKGCTRTNFRYKLFPINRTGRKGVITGEYILENEFQVERGYIPSGLIWGYCLVWW